MSRELVRIGGILSFMLFSACGTTISDYESPEHSIALEEGGYQIRKYPPVLAASASGTTDSSGFRKVYSFITGENSAEENISMTVPVRTRKTADGEILSFFVPSKYTRATLPAPLSDNVRLEEFAGGTFATLRFSGLTPASKVLRKLEEVRAWADSQGYEATDQWYLDRYDPPWTLPFMRTNEVLVRLKEPAGP